MVAAYWEIGREIVEEEQRGAERAAYGTQLLRRIGQTMPDSAASFCAPVVLGGSSRYLRR